MAWLYVFFDGIIEVFWVLGLKHSYNALTWGITVVLIIFSFYLLMKANESLPAGTVYAVFTGMGTAGIVLVDTFVFGTPISIPKIIFLLCIVTGVIGTKCITPAPKKDPKLEDTVSGEAKSVNTKAESSEVMS